MVTKAFIKVLKIFTDIKKEIPNMKYISKGHLLGELIGNVYSDPYRAKMMIDALVGMEILYLDTSKSPNYKINWELLESWKYKALE